jgi:Domain of unknown function (DUF4037)
MPPRFIAGLELSRDFYWQAVRPVLDSSGLDLPHAAALIGPGSEILGFDTERSTDHDWGPRVLLFLRPADRAAHGDRLDDLLGRRLPATFAGYPTNFAPPGSRTQSMAPTSGPVRHRVVVTDPGLWLGDLLGFDARRGAGMLDWLATPTQRLAEATGGAVFHDGPGELTAARERLRWYPQEMWRYLLACQWQRIAQEEAFVGRCVEVGDEIGAAIVAGRLVRDLIRLHLLMARRYPPYSKWLGSALRWLADPDEASGPLYGALASRGASREEHLARAYEVAAQRHNALGLTRPVDPATRAFHDRPFRVLRADRLADALLDGVTDTRIAALPRIGAIDQFADGTDLLGDIARCRAATAAVLDLEGLLQPDGGSAVRPMDREPRDALDRPRSP